MSQKRKADIDLLRVLAIMAVIVIHCIAWVQMVQPVGSTQWIIGNIIDSSVRWCVPVFVMISGLLLIKPEAFANLSIFFKKRLVRILIAIAIWPIIYTLWPLIMFNGSIMPERILQGYLGGAPVQIHLYFLFLIAGLYALTPIISLYASKVPIHTFRMTTYIIMAVTTLSHTIETFLPGHGVSLNMFTQGLPYVGYFMLGYAFKDYVVKRPAIPLMVFITGTACIAVLTHFLSQHYPVDGTGSFFYTYPSLFVMITSAAFFLLFRSYYDKFMTKLKEPTQQKVESVVFLLSNVTFGVYLIHIIILEAFETIFRLNPSGLKQSLLLMVLTIVGSFVATFVLTKLPAVRYILR